MNRILFVVVALFGRWFKPRYNAHIQILEAQISMLRSRIDASRIVPTVVERAELIRLGALVDGDIADVMHIVKPETFARWLRDKRRGRVFKKLGRPATAETIRKLIQLMAKHNLRWGAKRIVGELRKLGIKIGVTTTRDILKESGLHPSPGKTNVKPPMAWTTFVHAHMDVLVACDFFSKPVYTMRGVFTAYVFVFIHLGTRKIYCSSSTYHPDADWIMQQARNASMWFEEIGIEPRYLIRDRDRKFPDSFDVFWKDAGVRPIKIPPRAPRANAFCESFVGTIKKSCLNYFICFSLGQLDYINKTWLDHYHFQRPHQGKDIGNNVLDADFKPQTEGTIKHREKLGGIVSEYFREAA